MILLEYYKPNNDLILKNLYFFVIIYLKFILYWLANEPTDDHYYEPEKKDEYDVENVEKSDDDKYWHY